MTSVTMAMEGTCAPGFDRVRDVTTAEEHVTFPLPRELRA